MAAVDHFPEADVGQEVGPVEPQIQSCLVGVGGVTKGYFVKLSDAVTFEVVAAGAAKAYGTALKTVAEGGQAPILVYGIVPMLAGGAFVAGAQVKSDAAHKPVTGGVFADAAGTALQKASNAGDKVLIFVGKV